MRRYSVMYFISQSVKGLWRNGVMTLASIVVLMSCLVVMGSFSLIVMNLNTNLEALGDMNEIVAFIDLEKTEEEITAIRETIAKYDNIKDIEYISKEQALEQEKAKYADSDAGFFEDITSDVYPASVVVKYKDNTKVETLRYNLQNTEGVYKVRCNSEVANTIESLKTGVIYVFIWFLAVLFVVSVFVIINTIKLAVHARRQEITVMRYVGATNWFIMLPFVLEGVWIGLISSGVAYLLQMTVYQSLTKTSLAEFEFIKLIAPNEISGWFLLAFIVIGVLTGIIGSCISLNKHLKA